MSRGSRSPRGGVQPADDDLSAASYDRLVEGLDSGAAGILATAPLAAAALVALDRRDVRL